MPITFESMKAVPLTIEFPPDGNGGVITLKNIPSSGMWYSVNNGDKILIELTNYDIPVKAGNKISLYAKGTGSTRDKYLNISCSSGCYLYGNVMSSISRDDFETLTEVPENAFYGLFCGNDNIHNHRLKPIVLPATTLNLGCYCRMFKECISLTETPELPATKLADYCYGSMFHGCTSLTKAPELPATILADGCYQGMFYECSNLAEAPELFATTLAYGCYDRTFASCTSLTEAPELPAISLAESCYEGMFSGCTSLVKTSELPATTLAKKCYAGMFMDCTSLTDAPKLPATSLVESCYDNMFRGCTSLAKTSELPAKTSAKYCYRSMFYGCTSLTDAPKLPTTTLAEECYAFMFRECTSLKVVPELPATTLAKSCYEKMFEGCTSLTDAPELPAISLAESCYDNMFRGCISLAKTSELPAKTSAKYCYRSMFYGCTNLTNAPKLPATTLTEACYAFMFRECTSLTVAPELPATTLAEACYAYMFYGCTSLTNIPELPARTLTKSCYESMFEGCTSLTHGPNLPVADLADSCYKKMFYGCTNLTDTLGLSATTLSKSYFESMFEGCVKITESMYNPNSTLKFLLKQMQPDEKWLEWKENGFKWAYSKFGQEVIMENYTYPDMPDDPGCFFTVKSEMLKNLKNTAQNRKILNDQLFCKVSMCTPVYDEEKETLSLVIRLGVHKDIAYWMDDIIAKAMVLQMHEVLREAEKLAKLTKATPVYYCHPVNGIRQDIDAILGVYDEFIIPYGRQPSCLNFDDFFKLYDIFTSNLPFFDPSHNSYSARVKLPMGDSESTLTFDSNKRHPDYGTGCMVTNNYFRDKNEDKIISLAISKNRDIAAGKLSYGIGSFCYVDGMFAYKLFIPNLLCLPGILKNILYGTLPKARSVHDSLSSIDWRLARNSSKNLSDERFRILASAAFPFLIPFFANTEENGENEEKEDDEEDDEEDEDN